ncbi:hypothetical protein HHK36_016969 [Tetracentron sinense]|uniref:SHSP domain-containing protein n=1 Tax=Tetracentron sinense TaxID=13715 RepID=A0A835DBF7_TETSI|nr:hypothetical protein HHK36_016969 [Tetracentron sinense]
MDTKASATLTRSYEDFEPASNWVRDEGHDTLVVLLPGFKKENIRVQIDNLSNLKIGGERPLHENRWSGFRKEFGIPKKCDVNEIHAKFVGEVLHIVMPKTITGTTTQDQATSSQQPPTSRKPQSDSINPAEQAARIIGASEKPASGELGGAGEMIKTTKNVVCARCKPETYRYGLGGSLLAIAVMVALGVYVAHNHGYWKVEN